MRYEKTMMLFLLVVFLLGIACVSASEIDDATASEDMDSIELSADNVDDNLQNNEKNSKLTLTDNDETLSTKNDTGILNDNTGTYSGLRTEIGSGRNVVLQHDYYTYDGGNTIAITIANSVIDGKGAVIDMAGSNIRAFDVSASGVTIKNLTIKNANYNGEGGGAIYFSQSGTVSNCSFNNNSALNNGGAVWMTSGTVTNCNFTDNNATSESSWGGAICIDNSGTVSNCIFTHNIVNGEGGAIRMASGSVLNCNFTNNTGNGNGGAVRLSSGSVKNCNFVGNKATAGNSWGGSLYMSSGSVENCNFTNSVSFEGGAVFFYNTGNMTNCIFADNAATKDGGAVYFSGEGEVTDCIFTGNTAAKEGGAVLISSGSVENCSFTNNSAVNGGAVNFEEGEVKNCDFVNNTAVNGSAVYFEIGEVKNCDFVNNTAVNGGAVYFFNNGDITNCNFVNNSAAQDGGAVYFMTTGNVTGCIFTDNTAAHEGGAISSQEWFSTADTCIFNRNSDPLTILIIIYPPKLNVENFTIPYGSNKKLTFDLKTNSNISVTNGNISISVYSKDNDAWVGNYSCLSGEGWIPDLPIGYYYAIFNTDYAEFQPVNSTITVVPDNTFAALNYTINGNDNPVIELSHDFYFDSDCDAAFKNGVEIKRSVTIKGNGFVIDAKGQARIFNVLSDDVIIENLTLKNAHASEGGAVSFFRNGKVRNCNFVNNSATYEGGAVYFYLNGELTNCNFIDNTARMDGGAVCLVDYGNVINCNFTDNTASHEGGAIYIYSCGFENCNFTGNKASTGSAIYFSSTSAPKTVSNSIFLNNRANAETLNVVKNENNITITFTGQNNLLNAIYSRNDDEVSLTNVTYWGANGINNTGSSPIKPSRSNRQAGQNITVSVVVNGELVLNEVKVTDENGMIVLDISAGENYLITVRHEMDSYYTGAERTVSDMTFNVTIVPQTTHNRTVNITAKSNIYSEFMPGKLIFVLPNGANIMANYADNGTWWAVHSFEACADYQINANYLGLDNVTITNATISILKTSTEIAVENSTVELFVGDSVGIGATLTPADAGNLTFTSSNITVVKVEDGKIMAVGEGSAVITVSFAGNVDYEAAENKTISVTVNLNDASVGVNNSTLELLVGDSFTIVPTTAPGGLPVIFVSDNSGVYRVDDNGVVTALKEGTGTVTVKVGGDGVYAENSTVVSVTVNLNDVSVGVNNSTLELLVGDSFTIVPTTAPGGLPVIFVTDNSGVYRVDDNGVVTALKEGSGSLTVKVGGDGVYAKNSTVVSVTVSKVPTEITVENATVELLVGDSVGTGAALVPPDAGNVTYAVSNSSVVKVEDGKIIAVGKGSALITVSFAGDDKYADAESKTIAVMVKYESKVIISPIADVVYPNNVTIKYSIENRTNVSVSIAGVSDDKIIITNDTVTVIGLDAGEYTITIFNSENRTHYKSSDTKNFTVNKLTTSIAAASVSTVYNINKVVVITLKDGNGKALANAKVTVVLGKSVTYTTDKNGQVKVSTKGLVPKAYTAKITFNGNTNYAKSTKNVKVTVKKATPKIKAKKKTFKKSKKVKKYKIKLKDNLGKAIKKEKVTIKVGKKTFKAKTNSKGKATFKIKKLTKKGKYKAKIKYKGNKYYNKVTKKVKIKLK